MAIGVHLGDLELANLAPKMANLEAKMANLTHFWEHLGDLF